jgi:hypothetical protein
MLPENKIVHGLWIGDSLSNVELLTLRSFVFHGHDFHLWVYGQLKTAAPEGVVLKNANDIIPEERIFRYRNSNQFGHGKGSLAGFSDIFRYKLLYEKGGWWTDMDICCLKPLNFSESYVFRDHHNMSVVGNIMKCPVDSELMKACYREAVEEVDEENTDWHKPVEILNRNIKRLELEKFIRQGISTLDLWEEVGKYLKTNNEFPNNVFVFHLMNENWRVKNLDKNDFKIKSTYGKLMLKYKVVDNNFSVWDIFCNSIKYSDTYRLFGN